LVTVDPDAATGVALIIVDRDGQNLIAVASGANNRLTPNCVQMAESAIRSARVLAVQLEVPLETVTAALQCARQNGVTTVLNPAPARQVPDTFLGLVDWLTPNEHEAATLSGRAVVDAESAAVAGRVLVEKGAKHVVVTLGGRGAVYVTKDRTEQIAPFSVSAIDTTAAGDAFTAGLAVSLARGRSVEEALAFASAAGALSTTRRGAQPSLPTEVEVEALAATRVSLTSAT
jgi:ribokinase